MYLVAIAWMYVVLMMTLAEAMSPQGTVLGAVFTLVLYGVAPLALVLYLMGTPMRRRAQRLREAGPGSEVGSAGVSQPDGGRHAAGLSVAPVGEAPLGMADGAQARLGDPPHTR